jgi:negative regulator of sigma-B (phosphoserine phosphatase)
MHRHGRLGPIDWATARRPRPGEQACGDYPIAVEVDGGAAVFGVVDGLGHGSAAAEAAECAADVVQQDAAEPLEELIRRCHKALTATRGAAMTLARIDFQGQSLRWIGVGNVTGYVVAKSPKGVDVRSAVRLFGGIVGFRLPEILLAEEVPIAPGDLLIIASDGIGEDHLDNIAFAASATEIADRILDQNSKESDDALVLAARHRGFSP